MYKRQTHANFSILLLRFENFIRVYNTLWSCSLISSPSNSPGPHVTLPDSHLLLSTCSFLGIGLSMEHRQPTRCQTFEGKWLSLSQEPQVACSCLFRSVTPGDFIPSALASLLMFPLFKCFYVSISMRDCSTTDFLVLWLLQNFCPSSMTVPDQ